MIRKNAKTIGIEPKPLNLNMPKYSTEQKVVQKALHVLGQIGNPRFSATDNCWKTNLKAKDESRLWYARGLLESLLFEGKGEKDGND